MVELTQFLDEQKSRSNQVNYSTLRDPFQAAHGAAVVTAPWKPTVAPSRKGPAPPKLVLRGVARIDGTSTAFINGVAYRAGDSAGPFLIEDVANRGVIVSIGQDQWVVPIGESLRRGDGAIDR